MDAFAAIMPDLSLKYFVSPFLAYAIGTFSGVIIAGLIAARHKMKFSLGIGVIFIGGDLHDYNHFCTTLVCPNRSFNRLSPLA